MSAVAWLGSRAQALRRAGAARVVNATLTLACRAQAVRRPAMFNPADAYNADAVLLVSLAEGPPISLTAQQVTQMPWRQFVRLMKARQASLTAAAVALA